MDPPGGTFIEVQKTFSEKLKENSIAVPGGNVSISADLVVYRKMVKDKAVDRTYIRFSAKGVNNAKVPASAHWLQVVTRQEFDATGAPVNFNPEEKVCKSGYSAGIIYVPDPDAPKEIPKDKAFMPVLLYHAKWTAICRCHEKGCICRSNPNGASCSNQHGVDVF
jgi:hypothetical protein